MSTIVAYVPIQSGAGATPGLFNSRMSQLQLNIEAINIDKLETVATADIEDGAITNAKLGSNAVTNSKVLDNSLVGAKLNANSLDFSSNVSVNSLSLKASTSKLKLYFSSGALRYAYDYGGTVGDIQLISPRLRPVTPTTLYPTSSVSVGSAGEISASSQYIYICVSSNSWKRAALSGW